jgi:Cu/Ag efflux protein CusF
MINNLLKWIRIALPLGLLATGCGKQAEEKPGVARIAVMSLTASVTAIDHIARTLTLQHEAGNTRTFKVSEAVENFGHIQPGDEIKVSFYESFVAYVSPPHEETPLAATTGVGVAAPEGKLGTVTIDTHQLTTSVEAIDVASRMVTLKGPKGNVLTLPVKDDVKNLDKLKVGDQVTFQVTEPMVIAVEKIGGTH